MTKTLFLMRKGIVAGAVSAILFLTGCMSTATHALWYDVKFSDAGPKALYPGTRSAAVCAGREKTWSKSPFMAVFCIIDLPLDVVADTVFLPLDVYEHCRDTSDIAFWKDVFAGDKTSLSLETYERHLSRCGRSEVRNALKAGEDNKSRRNGKPVSPEMRALLSRHPAWAEH